jgi:serine/threonine-protein kinase
MNASVTSLHQYRTTATQNHSKPGRLCGSSVYFRDRYQMVRPLGRGGFGVTYLARDMNLPGEPECVIKQLSPKSNNPAVLQRAAERFEREAKILAKLGSHAQIPQLLDYFQMEGEFFLVQEYIRGMTLAKEIRHRGVYSEAKVKQFLAEILPVLDYVHQNQVIHRDIKPPNIIRCQDDGRLVMIDFGAVKEEIAELGQTAAPKGHTTQFVGTVGFAPPEQLSLRPVYASDVYAVGVTCLYLLTGKSPIEFEIDPASGEVDWQTDLPGLSSHFSKVLDKMLRIDPGDRYQSAEQVSRALELEPYLDNLASCLNVKSHRTAAKAEATISSETGSQYLTPIARTARDIRNWRARLCHRQQRKVWQDRPVVLSSGCCG